MKKRVTVTAVAEYHEENIPEEGYTDDQLKEMLLELIFMGDYPLEPTVETIEGDE